MSNKRQGNELNSVSRIGKKSKVDLVTEINFGKVQRASCVVPIAKIMKRGSEKSLVIVDKQIPDNVWNGEKQGSGLLLLCRGDGMGNVMRIDAHKVPSESGDGAQGVKVDNVFCLDGIEDVSNDRLKGARLLVLLAECSDEEQVVAWASNFPKTWRTDVDPATLVRLLK